MAKFLAHLRLGESEMPSCDFPAPKSPKSPASPFHLNVTNFCFRKGPAKSVVYQPEGHPKQAVIDGHIWPPIFEPKNVRSAQKLVVKDSDVFVVTYPKCGTTWIQHIVMQLTRAEAYNAKEGNEMCLQSPMIERMGAPYVDQLKHPRVLKSHFDHNLCPQSSKAKYIYCVRNPKDCLTSYFHHNRNFKIYNYANGDFDTFLDLFLNGQLAFGDYFDHLLSWLPHIHDENVLFLTYEHMLSNLEDAVFKIGQFLGGRAQEMVEDPEVLARVVAASRMDAMKEHQERWFPANQLSGQFIRKGQTRDWKNHMTQEQSERCDAVIRTRTAGTAAQSWWKEEMSWAEDIEDEMERLEIEDDFDSVSRRGSIITQSDQKDAHSADRRWSYSSLLSTGYGSVWSLANHH